MIKSHNELFYKIIAAVLSVFMLWIFAGTMDYHRVFYSRKKPLFCIPFSVRENITNYNGIGYSYFIEEEEGKFISIDFENFLHANVYERFVQTENQ